MAKVKIGDIFEIPLSNGKVAYGQYLLQTKLGPLIQIFDVYSGSSVKIEEIIRSPALFPPILTGLYAAIEKKLWKVIGNSPVNKTIRPNFISTEWDKDGNATFWYHCDGEKYYKIGEELPDKYKGTEFLIIYPPNMVRDRIEEKKIPFPYLDLIKYNSFTPYEE